MKSPKDLIKKYNKAVDIQVMPNPSEDEPGINRALRVRIATPDHDEINIFYAKGEAGSSLMGDRRIRMTRDQARALMLAIAMELHRHDPS